MTGPFHRNVIINRSCNTIADAVLCILLWWTSTDNNSKKSEIFTGILQKSILILFAHTNMINVSDNE